jgi:hypothetical protein
MKKVKQTAQKCGESLRQTPSQVQEGRKVDIALLKALVLGLVLLCASCGDGDTIHWFPSDGGVSQTIDISISLDIDMAFASDTLFQTYADMLAGDYDVRYTVDIYDFPQGNTIGDEPVRRLVQTENTLIRKGIYDLQDTVNLPLARYYIVAWLDFVDKGTANDKYYSTANLRHITINKFNGKYDGYNVTKDAFTGKVEMDLTPYIGKPALHYRAKIEMIRPFAEYQIRTTDLKEYYIKKQQEHQTYAEAQPVSTLLAYNLFFPQGYDCYKNIPLDYQAGIYFNFPVEVVDNGEEAILASDLVFVENETFYRTTFEVFTPEQMHINTVEGVRINLKRNHLSILRGAFLTTLLNDGSVGINDNFDEEIIVYY